MKAEERTGLGHSPDSQTCCRPIVSLLADLALYLLSRSMVSGQRTAVKAPAIARFGMSQLSAKAAAELAVPACWKCWMEQEP